jgi:hypothetical protein
VPEPQRAVVAFALARRAVEDWPGTRDDPKPAEQPGAGTAETVISRKLMDKVQARKALDTIYASTPPGNLVTHMPWLGWAEQYLSDGQIAGAPALRDLREQVYAHVLTPESASAAGPGNDDLVGGIVFTTARIPAPTWQTVRPAAFLASALGDQRLTDPGEVLKELSRHLTVLGFLRQLTADGGLAWMCFDPAGAQWGVRAAAWDQRQTPEATAMTLITVCETLRSLDEIAKRTKTP